MYIKYLHTPVGCLSWMLQEEVERNPTNVNQQKQRPNNATHAPFEHTQQSHACEGHHKRPIEYHKQTIALDT